MIRSYPLPEELHEISGIISLDQGKSFFALNDGGNPAIIYHLDETGEILRRIKIKNAINIDWEELTTDFVHHVFIADTGDNKRKRPKKQIYKIKIEELLKFDTVTAKKIDFYFFSEDKKSTREDTLKTYDIEAMYWFDHSLYFFSKNWNKKKSPRTRLYKADPDNSHQILRPEFTKTYTHRFYLESQITGACTDPLSQKVYLLTSTEIFEMDPYQTEDKWLSHKFNFISQKEAICCYKKNHFVVAQEKNRRMNQSAQIHYIQMNPSEEKN
ncbi:MAG: hypothetical protein IPM48_03775 [Saprospiraceae bacterium]|nr:hypothetical protein [Saprospiraceae bacterium]